MALIVALPTAATASDVFFPFSEIRRVAGGKKVLAFGKATIKALADFGNRGNSNCRHMPGPAALNGLVFSVSRPLRLCLQKPRFPRLRFTALLCDCQSVIAPLPFCSTGNPVAVPYESPTEYNIITVAGIRLRILFS